MVTAYCKDCVKEFGVMDTGRHLFFPPAHHKPRPAPHPGPRCATHWRAAQKGTKTTQHERYVQRVYGLPPGGYQELYEHQGGKCALCQRSKGIKKRLAVDHDHETGLAYGLLCGPCNKDVMGWSRRDPQYFQRCIQYLVNPPARQLRIVAYHIEKRNADE